MSESVRPMMCGACGCKTFRIHALHSEHGGGLSRMVVICSQTACKARSVLTAKASIDVDWASDNDKGILSPSRCGGG